MIHSRSMAVNTQSTVSTAPPRQPQQLSTADVNSSETVDTFSVSVGSDSWAGEVINNVVGSTQSSSSSSSSASVTPPSSSAASVTPPSSSAASVTPSEASDQAPALDPVQAKILEKKRLFHKNRFLELKNLPETVTEQVG